MIIIRIWHKDLIRVLPRQQLLGQWRECCLIAKEELEALAETDPDQPIHVHVLIDRLWKYPEAMFNCYADLVYQEMRQRGYKADWNRFWQYRINRNLEWETWQLFPEWHNTRYLKQCLYNLQEKHDCGAIPEEEWERIIRIFPEWK